MKTYMNYSIIVILMLIVMNLEAQSLEEIIGFEDDVSDTSSAPINFFITIAILIGAALGIKKLK